jgi:hypothetical protein
MDREEMMTNGAMNLDAMFHFEMVVQPWALICPTDGSANVGKVLLLIEAILRASQSTEL